MGHSTVYRRIFTICTTLIFLFTSYVAKAADRFHVNVTSVSITSADDIVLQGRLYLPERQFADQKLPGIVEVNPWALSSDVYFAQAKELASRGFIVICYNSRGFGQSGGVIDGAAEKDIADASKWIDWLIDNTPVDAENIGMVGMSLGAGISLMTTAYDSRIKTVVSMSGWTDFYNSMYYQGSAPNVWTRLLISAAKLLGRIDPILLDFMDRTLYYKVGEKEMRSWADRRSPARLIDAYNRRDVSIYIQHGMEDFLFNPNQVVNFYDKLTGDKKLDLLLGVHVGSELLGLIGFDNERWRRTANWLELKLKKTPTPGALEIMNHQKITVAVKLSKDSLSFNEWPTNIENHRYHLTLARNDEVGIMSEVAPNGILLAQKTIISEKGSGISSGIPILNPTLEAHAGIPTFQFRKLMSARKAMIFESIPIEENSHIMGSGKIVSWITPQTEKMSLIAYLYSVNKFGIATLVTHSPLTLHQAVKGVPIKLTWELFFTSYRVHKGSKLLLAFATKDLNYASPNDERYEVKFNFSDDMMSELTLPILPSN